MTDHAEYAVPDNTAPVKPCDVWDFFDGIYCISLESRADRREQAVREFARVGLADRVRFWIVQKDPDDSEKGIFESHIRCLGHALEAGAQTALVFEDDVCFDRFSSEALMNAVEFLKCRNRWHMFFLGCFVRKVRTTPCPSVVHVDYAATTHAYAVSREFAQRLAALSWQGVAYDDVLRDMRDPEQYALYPACAFQSDLSSDNDKLARLYYLRTVLGGMRRLQKWNEFRHYHVRALVIWHTVAVLLLGLLLFLMWKRL